MKLRRDSILAALTEEQQDQLFDWLETLKTKDVLEKIAKPS